MKKELTENAQALAATLRPASAPLRQDADKMEKEAEAADRNAKFILSLVGEYVDPTGEDNTRQDALTLLAGQMRDTARDLRRAADAKRKLADAYDAAYKAVTA